MKALQFNKNYTIDIIDTPVPQPDGNMVIMKVEQCGICGSDIHMFANGSGVNHGVIPGHEYTGIVSDPGSRTDLKVGDRVMSNVLTPCGVCPTCKSGHSNCCMRNNTHGIGLNARTPGAMAEFVACFPERTYRMPETLDNTLGTLADPLAVALHAISTAHVTVGSKVLITGGGPIGLCVALCCKIAGASLVVMTEASQDKITVIPKEFPEVDCVLDARSPELIPKLMEVSQGGFDCAVDCCGFGSAVEACIYAMRANGHIALAGVTTENISIPSVYIMINELVVTGSMCYVDHEFETAIKLLDNPKNGFARVISRVITMDQAQEYLTKLHDHSIPDYKVVLDVRKSCE